MEDIFKDSNTVITPELNDFYSNSFLVKGNPADENVLPAPQVGGNDDDKANVRSLINKLNNISDLSKNNVSNLQATYTDPLADAKMFAFNPTYKGLNWDRYKSHSAFNELGFDPFRDNEKFYNENTSIYSDITRGIQGFGKITASAFMNTAADLPRLLTGNWDPNTEAAKETERIMAETMSTRGTFGSSVINFGINAGFTVGIIGELIAEEMILAAVGLVGTPETAGASFGAAAYLMAVKAGMAGTKIAGLGRTTGALLKTIKSLDNAVDAKKYFNQFGRGAAEFLNPLQATTDLAKNWKNLNGLGQTARAAKSFGAFFKDIRDINRSFSEAKLEGGFVQNAMFEKLLNESYANGKTPTPEEIDKIKEASLHAGYVNQMVNFPVIHYTNNIAFGNLVKPLNRLIGSTEDSIRILNKTITADITRKKVFQELAGGWKESLKRGFNPKLMAKNSLNYFSANLAEGLQESFQEASAIAIEDYYTKLFNNENSIVRNQYELSILDSYGKGIGEQFSGQGAETFLSGFLMGGLMGRGGKIARKIGTGLNESSNKVKDLFYSKTDPTAFKEAKEKREIAKAEKEAKIKKYDEFRTNLINNLNEFYEDAGKMFSRDLEHMSVQEILDAKAKQAQETGDDKFLIDFTDTSLFESVTNALYFGKFDLYLEHLDKIKSLDDQGLMEAMGIDDAQAGRQRLEVSIERAKEIKTRSKKFSENPYKYNDYKEGTDEYNEMVLMHNAFEDAKKSAIFTPYQFDRVLSRMNSISESFSSIDLVANGNATEFLHLFGIDNIVNEVEILDTEIQSLKDGTKENEALARRKEKQIKDLAEVRDAIIAHRAYFKALKENDEVDTSYEKNLKNAFIKYLGSYGENKSRILKSDKLDDAFKLFHDYYRLNIDAEYLSKSVAIVADPDFLRQESLRRYNALKKQYTNRKELIKKKWDTYLRKIGLNGVFQKLYEAGFAGDPEQMVAYNLSGGKKTVNLFYRVSDFSRVTAADVEDLKKIKEIFDEYEDITGITKAKEEAAKKAAEAAAKKLEEEAEAARVAAKEKALDIYTPETKAKLVADYENYPEKDTESFEEYLETPRAARIIAAEVKPAPVPAPIVPSTLDNPFSNIESFETAKGSIYTVLPNGKTQRFKTATNELNEPNDLIVFVKFKNAEEEQDFLEAQNRLNNQKLYVVDSEGNIYNTNKETLGKAVKLVIIKDDKVIKSVETSLEPKIGYNTFDQRRYEENGVQYRSTHLGNKVTKINYKTPETITPTFNIEEKRKEVRAAIQRAGQGEGGQFFVTLSDGTREAAVRISLVGDELFIGNKGDSIDIGIIDKVENPDGTVLYDANAPVTPSENKTKTTKRTFEELKSEIERLRAEEEVKYSAIDPNDTVARAKIYEEYNVLITPLLKEAKADVKKRREEELKSINGIKNISRGKTFYHWRTSDGINVFTYDNIVSKEEVENKINDKYNAELESLNKKETLETKPVQETEVIGEEEEPTKKELTEFQLQKKNFTLSLNVTPNIKAYWNTNTKTWKYFNKKGKEVTDTNQILKYGNKLIKIPNVVKLWWTELLSSNNRNTVIDYMENLYKYYQMGMTNSQTVYENEDLVIIRNLVNKKFKPTKELISNLTDVNLKKWTKEGLGVTDGLDIYANSLKYDLEEAGFSNYDEQDIMNMILDIINQYPNGITKKIYQDLLKESNYNQDLIDVVNEFSEKFGLDIETLAQELYEFIENFEQYEEEPFNFQIEPESYEDIPGFEELINEEEQQQEVKPEFPLSPQFEGKIIYFSPGLGKTTLVNQYPDQFVDMDVLLYEEFKDEPGFENVTPETIGEVVFDMYDKLGFDNFNPIKEKYYNAAFEKAKQLTKQGKTVLTGSGAFISKADFSVKANNENILKEGLEKKNPNIDKGRLSRSLKSITKKENQNNILLSVNKESLIQLLMGNYDLLQYINQDITYEQLDELGKFMTSATPKEIIEAFSKKMEYLQSRELLFSSLQPGDTVIILNEKTGKNYTTKIMRKKDANTYDLEIVPNESSYLMRSNLKNLINVIPAQGTSEGIKVDEVDNSNAEDNKTKVNDIATESERLKALLKESFNDDDLFEDAEDPNNCKTK